MSISSISLRTGWLAGCAALALFAGAAQADPIDYIFTGTGTGTLDGTAFSGAFTLTEVADTSGITSGGGEYRNTASSATFDVGALTATFTAPVVIDDTATPGYIGFTESVAPYSAEALTNSVFETYGLNTALSSTTGTLSVAPATFSTSVGDLDFSTITALSFEATVPSAVPEPSMLFLLLPALLGFVAVRKLRPVA